MKLKRDKLGNLCLVFADGDWIETKDQSPSGIRLIQTGNIGDGIFKARDEKSRYISEENFKRLKCTEVIPGDCLISRLPEPVGRSCIIPDIGERMITAVDCTIVRPDKNKLNSKFLNYFTQSIDYQSEVDAETTGTTRKRISRSRLGSISIPLPPLAEQERIIAILDQALAAIDIVKTNTEKVLEEVGLVFDSFLSKVLENPTAGWEKKTLGEICKIERGSSPRPIKNFVTTKSDGVNWIKIGDTKYVDRYIYTTKEKITPEGAKKSRLVNVDDFILSNSMSFGKPYIMKTQGYIHDGWFVLRLPSSINKEYFWYLLSSLFVRSQFDQLASGAIVQNVSSDLVKKVILPIPSLHDQEKLVSELDHIKYKIDDLKKLYVEKLIKLDVLKQSILQKAFSGEL